VVNDGARPKNRKERSIRHAKPVALAHICVGFGEHVVWKGRSADDRVKEWLERRSSEDEGGLAYNAFDEVLQHLIGSGASHEPDCIRRN
jgi:hypothetical protein